MHITWLEKKGVSPVIAVVLMIAVAVAIAVIVYAWASGFTSEKTVESKRAEILLLENQKLSGTALIVYIRNDTKTVAILDAVYHNGVQIIAGAMMTMYCVYTPTDPTSTNVTEINLTDVTGNTFSAGDDVMLVTEEGTQIKFKVKG